jgi:hypothetical protein
MDTSLSLKRGAQRDQQQAEVGYVTVAIASRSSHLQSPATGGSYARSVHMTKLTEEREITPYTWVSPDDDDGVAGNSIHVRRALSSLRYLRS